MKINKPISRALRLVLSLLLLVVLSVTTVPGAYASGSKISDAVKITFGETYSKSWTANNDHLNHYVKLTLTERGIVSMKIQKPVDAEGEYSKLEIILCDEEGTPIWGTGTRVSVDNASEYYKFSVGLDKGVYYVSIIPDFYVTSGSIQMEYSFSFEADAHCEIEPNSSLLDATLMEQNFLHTGFFGNELSNYEKADFFKFSVVAGHTYRLCSGGEAVGLFMLTMPGQEETNFGHYMKQNINSEGMYYVDYTATTTGTAYLKIYNNWEQFKYQFRVNDLTCEKKGHTYGSWEITKEATCSNTGAKVATCTGCGAQKTETISKTAHTYGDWKITKEATCADAGSRVATCQSCGEQKTETISKLAHTYGDWELTKAATCAETGVQTTTCENCGNQITTEVEKAEHEYGLPAVVKNPSARETGIQESTCKACGNVMQESIPKTESNSLVIILIGVVLFLVVVNIVFAVVVFKKMKTLKK